MSEIEIVYCAPFGYCTTLGKLLNRSTTEAVETVTSDVLNDLGKLSIDSISAER